MQLNMRRPQKSIHSSPTGRRAACWLACCLSLAMHSISGAQESQDWPLFRGDSQSTGVARSQLTESPEVLWEFKVPQGGFEGTPVVVKNKSNGRLTVYIGDMDGVMFSLDLETGKENWRYDTGLGFAASPAYRDGRIFIGDIDGYFWCLDEQGKEVWKFETQAEISGSANFYQQGVLFGSQDAKLYLLDQATGEKIWEFETPDQIQCSTTVAGDRAFVAGCDGYLHVINLKDGSEVGKVDIRSPTRSTPAVWEQTAAFGTEQADFLAVDWKQVESSWTFADEDGQSAVRGSAAINDKHVIFGARNRQVYSLDRETGKQQWTQTLKAKVESSPVIEGQRVWVGSTDGRLYALSLADGTPGWQRQFNGGFLGSPAIAYGRLVVATDRGVVYCLGEKPTQTSQSQ